MNDKDQERRKDIRFVSKKRLLTSIKPTPEETYHIIDISMGGMAFRYLGSSRRYEQNILSGDLILEKSGLNLEKIPFEIISDQMIDDSHVPMRRCGVQFKKTSLVQQEKLGKIIAQCRNEELPKY